MAELSEGLVERRINGVGKITASINGNSGIRRARPADTLAFNIREFSLNSQGRFPEIAHVSPTSNWEDAEGRLNRFARCFSGTARRSAVKFLPLHDSAI